MPFKTSELDLFVIESRTKKSIHSLLIPIIGQIESERAERARVEIQYDQILQKLL